MLDKCWDFFVNSCMTFFIPLVCSYFALTSNIFLNTSHSEATGLEKWGNAFLAPCQYLFVGQTATKIDGRLVLSDRFTYQEYFALKTASCSVAAIPGFALGVICKGLSLLEAKSMAHQRSIESSLLSTEIYPQNYGFDPGKVTERFLSQGHARRPGDEQNLAFEKAALKEIGALFDQAGIPWWVDAGTCLGAYRYGGVIPWDEDVDIAVLLPDFENVSHLLNKLDPKKYIVQNWSSRDYPKSYLKIYVRQSNTFVDIYHFKILPGQLQYILALEHNIFLPEWWQIRERRFTEPVALETVFPLKRALFDGIEVNIPNDTKKYLQRYYGENLDPAKIFDPVTNGYEKDLSHPYWQRAYVH